MSLSENEENEKHHKISSSSCCLFRYQGGKQAIARQIADHIENYRVNKEQVYFEPFVGAGSVLSTVSGKRIGSDLCEDLILLHNECLEGTFQPLNYPSFHENEDTSKQIELAKKEETIRKKLYQEYAKKGPSAIRAYIGFGWSYSGIFLGGYSSFEERKTKKKGRTNLKDYRPRSAYFHTLKYQEHLQKSKEDIQFIHGSYLDFEPHGLIIFCDPPYKGTRKYNRKEFISFNFWKTMERWVKDNVVLITEYTCPSSSLKVFEEIVDFKMGSNMQGKNKGTIKLFVNKNRNNVKHYTISDGQQLIYKNENVLFSFYDKTKKENNYSLKRKTNHNDNNILDYFQVKRIKNIHQ